MNALITTTAIPQYLIHVDLEHLSKHHDFDYVDVMDVERVDHLADGTPIFEPADCIGSFMAWFHHYDGDIDARPQVAMSLAQIAEIFLGVEYSVHLAGTVSLDRFLEITNRSGEISDHGALFTIEVTAVFADEYALLDEVVRRLIHHAIWESAKNIAQP